MLMQTPVPERCIVLAYLLITHFSLYDLPKIFSTGEPNRFRDSHLDDPISINDVTSGDKHALPNMECLPDIPFTIGLFDINVGQIGVDLFRTKSPAAFLANCTMILAFAETVRIQQ